MLVSAVGEPLLTFETPDGRTQAYALWGDPEDFPVLVLHGTPGCRLERWPDEEVYRRLGIFVVTHDRAGYGRSTRRPGPPGNSESTTSPKRWTPATSTSPREPCGARIKP